MLADRDIRLLTAAVDGELSGRERKALQRLLQKSSEARAFLEQLRGDAGHIRGLPRPRLGPDFTGRVCQAIAERGLRPGAGHRAPAAKPAVWPAWGGWAAAAAVLVSVGILSYLAFPRLFKGERRRSPLVQNRAVSPKRTPADQGPKDRPKLDGTIARASKGATPMVDEGGPPKPDKKGAAAAQGPRDKKDGGRNPKPRAVGGSKHDWDLPPVAHGTPPLRVAVKDLEVKEAREKLRGRLARDTAFHAQLLCRDPGRGLDEIRGVFAAHGIHLLIDREAQARLKNPGLKTNYLLYTDDVKPDELVKILRQVGQADRMRAAREKVPVQFDTLFVNALAPAFRHRLEKHLGAPPVKPAGKPKGDDPRKQDSGGGAQIGPAVPMKSNAAPAQPRGPARHVLVLAYNLDDKPVRAHPGQSPEMKLFRQARKERRAGALQVVLVLRRASA